jgi:hypothetical protein
VSRLYGHIVVLCAAVIGTTLAAQTAPARQSPSHLEIPQTWDDAAWDGFEVPLPAKDFSPKHVPRDYYERIPVRPIYQGFPVYAVDREPAGYFDRLKTQPSSILWDDSHRPPLETTADWIAAGRLVFEAAIFYDGVASADDVRTSEWYRRVRPPLTSEGVLPFTTYVVRERGKVELGNNACAFCHTRLQPDGTLIRGAQGNFPFDRAVAFSTGRGTLSDARTLFRSLFGAPWLGDRDPAVRVKTMPMAEMLARWDAVPPGVIGRHRASVDSPPAVPDLIGIKDRKYLDKSGLVVHRGIGDLMRYASLNNELDFMSSFGGFIPSGIDFKTLPPPEDPLVEGRYSDEQLYALALYLYSLTPPPNPNRADATSAAGERVFRREGCATCHTPPLYTNNKRVPAPGFDPPRDAEDVLRIRVGTDPTLTLFTRRGTGFYKVPSLRGIWYRGPLEHNGSIASLEDWFDRRRLSDDYVPTGWIGYGVTKRAVKGHEFGLRLDPSDKAALIAFLRTL